MIHVILVGPKGSVADRLTNAALKRDNRRGWVRENEIILEIKERSHEQKLIAKHKLSDNYSKKENKEGFNKNDRT